MIEGFTHIDGMPASDYYVTGTDDQMREWEQHSFMDCLIFNVTGTPEKLTYFCKWTFTSNDRMEKSAKQVGVCIQDEELNVIVAGREGQIYEGNNK